MFLLILERKGETDRHRETSMWERNIDWLPPVCAPNGDWTHNLGTCPDQELNPQPLGMTLQPTELLARAQATTFICSLCILPVFHFKRQIYWDKFTYIYPFKVYHSMVLVYSELNSHRHNQFSNIFITPKMNPVPVNIHLFPLVVPGIPSQSSCWEGPRWRLLFCPKHSYLSFLSFASVNLAKDLPILLKLLLVCFIDFSPLFSSVSFR